MVRRQIGIDSKSTLYCVNGQNSFKTVKYLASKLTFIDIECKILWFYMIYRLMFSVNIQIKDIISMYNIESRINTHYHN